MSWTCRGVPGVWGGFCEVIGWGFCLLAWLRKHDQHGFYGMSQFTFPRLRSSMHSLTWRLFSNSSQSLYLRIWRGGSASSELSKGHIDFKPPGVEQKSEGAPEEEEPQVDRLLWAREARRVHTADHATVGAVGMLLSISTSTGSVVNMPSSFGNTL